MAYIPPHKRYPRDIDKPTPTAELLAPLFNIKLNLRPSAPRFIRKDLKPSGRKGDRIGKIIFSDQPMNKWFSIGSFDDGNLFPSGLHLERFSVPSIERRWGLRPLALMNSNLSQGNKLEEEGVTEPWETIAVKLLRDLLSSVELVKNEMNQDADVKLKLVARIGKVLFYGDSVIEKTELPTESTLRQLRRSFYTNFSDTYLDYIIGKVIPLIGVEFKEEKDIYHVKIELNRMRHFFADISCLKQKIDLRLLLYAKKIKLEKLTDDEMEGILDLINSAVLDQDVMDGLRWPLGKASSGDRFRVVGMWHSVVKSYVNPVVRLKLRNVDRYDFETSVGEVSKEVILKLKQVTSELLREKAQYDVISDTLNDTLKLIWNHFVCYSSCLSPIISV